MKVKLDRAVLPLVKAISLRLLLFSIQYRRSISLYTSFLPKALLFKPTLFRILLRFRLISISFWVPQGTLGLYCLGSSPSHLLSTHLVQKHIKEEETCMCGGGQKDRRVYYTL